MAHFNSSRGFGVEIELRPWQFRQDGSAHRITPSQVARWLNSVAGVEAQSESYNHHTRTHWKVTTDESCSSNHYSSSMSQEVHMLFVNRSGKGIEVVSPILYGHEGLEMVKGVIRKLKAHGAVVDETTGLHVHHDARDFSVNAIKMAYGLYAKFQESFNEMVSEDRRHQYYCQTLDPERAQEMLRAVDRLGRDVTPRSVLHSLGYHSYSDRFSTLNLLAHVQHGSIEFRQHQGSLDAQRVASWIVVTQLLMLKAMETKRIGTWKINKGRNDVLRVFLMAGNEAGASEFERKAISYLRKN